MKMTQPQSQSHSSPSDDFASMWEDSQASYDYVLPKRGDLRDGTVISIRADEVIIDIGGKQDALLATRELQRLTPADKAFLLPGTTVSVYVRTSPRRNSHSIST